MIRRLNYTERKHIPRECVSISVIPDGAFSRIEAALDLRDVGLPPDAAVAIEAYHQNGSQRFAWGTVSEPRPPADRRLTEFGDARGVKFRVKVVVDSPRKGLLVAEADRLIPRTEDSEDGKRRPLLPVSAENLYGEPWRLEIRGEDPLLKVDESLGDPVVFSRSPQFQALAYPAVVRQILTAIRDCPEGLDREEASGWRRDWLDFFSSLPGIPPQPDHEDDDAVDAWIDAVVMAFCRKHHLVEQLCQSLSAEAS